MTADIETRIRQNFPQLAAQMDAVPETFAPGWLKDAACQKAGADDFGPDIFEEPLRRLCISANEDADLNPLGRMILAQTIITQLGNRILLQNLRQQNAAELQCGLIPPIVVTGLPRTGTTALHRLLASDPAHVAIPYWQLNRPIPRTEQESDEDRQAEVQQNIALRSALTPELDKIHLIRAELPEECMFVTASSMQSRLYWNLAPVYGFMEWYNGADRRDKYREYAEWLRLFQSQHPGKRLVMKAPDHVDGIDALLEAIPDAIIVQTHRDMKKQICSYLSLGSVTRRIAVQSLDTGREVDAVLRLTESSIARNNAARKHFPNRIIDIRYNDLISDPLRTVEQVYSAAGIDFSAPARTKLEEHHSQNRKGKHGEHTYDLQQFGLNEGDITSRFATYTADFIGN